MNTSIFVENIKCGGCSNSIQSKLEKMVSEVTVDVENGRIDFSYNSEDEKTAVLAALEKMGYPKIGESKFAHKAKSYVSCIIGRMK